MNRNWPEKYSHAFNGILGDRVKRAESRQIARDFIEKYKDRPDVFRIIAAITSAINQDKSAQLKSIRSFSRLMKVKNALSKANVLHFVNGRNDAWSLNADWLDHIDMGKDKEGNFHLISRPYGLCLTLENLDQFKTLIENGMSVCIGADLVHFPNWTIEIEVRPSP